MAVDTWPPGVAEREGRPASPRPPRTILVPPGTPRAYPYTATRETDARGALTRGLAEYVEDVTRFEMPGGRLLQLNQVFSDWADPEEVQTFPSAIVYTTGPGTYEASKLTPVPDEEQRIPQPDGRYLVSASEMSIELVLEVWCNDVEERRGFGMALEDSLSPFVGMYGLILELPHYHQMRATFEPLRVAYPDSEAEAIKRLRRVVFSLTGNVPVVQLFVFPETKVSARVVEVGTNVIVNRND